MLLVNNKLVGLFSLHHKAQDYYLKYHPNSDYEIRSIMVDKGILAILS